MSTTIEAIHEYAHDLETVFGEFSNPRFYVAKFEGVGARNTIETSREVPLEVPGAQKSLLGGWTTIVQTEDWSETEDGDYVNELDITSEGVPARMSGAMHLYATDTGCTNEVSITIDCSIPLIGGRLERFVGATTAAQLDDEYAFIQAWLDEL